MMVIAMFWNNNPSIARYEITPSKTTDAVAFEMRVMSGILLAKSEQTITHTPNTGKT